MAGIRFFPADNTEQRQLLQRLLCWSSNDKRVSAGFKPSFGPFGMVELPASICSAGYGDLLLKPGGTAVTCNAAATTWTAIAVNTGDTAAINTATCTEPAP